MMKWNVEKIVFLYPPDVFAGTFDNTKMQKRHEQQVRKKLDDIKLAINRENDPIEAMNMLHNKDRLQFLLNNLGVFRDVGRLEKAVLALYGKLNAPFASGGDAAVWNSLFEACDTTRLYSLGDPVMFESGTVYRGSVSGWKRSLSWTPDKQRAEWFAKRWKDPSLGGGELYEVDITKTNILIYLKHRHEEEMILAPEFIKSARIRAFKTAE